MMGVDPRRFGPYATRGYLKAKNEEAYANVFTVALSGRGARRGAAAEARALLRPHEGARRRVRLGLRLGAAELVRAGGLRLRRGRARQAATCSSTRTIAPADARRASREKWSFRRSNYFEFVGDECRNVHENVGLQDMSPSPSATSPGPAREAWLDVHPRQPHPEEGRPHRACAICCRRTAACAPSSRSTARRADGFYLVSAGALRAARPRLSLRSCCPRDGSVDLQTVTDAVRRARRSPARARARCCRSSPTPTSRTRPSPGSPARPINVGAAHARCAARQFRRRARLGAAPSDRDAEHDLRPADGGRRARSASSPSASARWTVAGGSRNPTGSIGARAVDRILPRSNSGLDRFVHPNKGDVHRPRRAGRLAASGASGTASSRWRCTA